MNVWAQHADIVRMWGNSGKRVTGWNSIQEHYINLWKNYPDPAKDLKLDITDYHIQILENTAWVINNENISRTVDGKSVTTHQWNVRFLEKEKGNWKLAYVGVGSWLKDPVLNGPELWQKTIAYHDPDGIWEKFNGKVHLISVHANGNVYNEELEIQKEKNFYQSKRFVKDVIAIRGIRDGKAFYSVNGNNNPSKDEIKRYNLSTARIQQHKEHHTCHIGLPMELKSAGVEVLDKVENVEFRGKNCYALSFRGDPQKVKHEYYAGDWTLYIDPETFAMVGVNFNSEDWNSYFVAHGEIEINGIKMPMIKNYFNKNDSYRFTDNFTKVKK